MTIALDLSVSGSITSYGGLVDAIRDMADDETYSVSVIDAAMRKAEAHFNRVLRVPDMEVALPLSAASEYADLPLDFLEMRAIRTVGSSCQSLKSFSPATLYMQYRGRSGTPDAYAVEGNRLRFAPVGTVTCDMLYYAAIPALTDANPSNWLLRKHPDAYLAGALYHIARRERDSDGMAQAIAELNDIIDSISDAGERARWGAGPLAPQGTQQVRGART